MGKVCVCVCVCVKITQSWPTLCNPMDYIVHGILQARILEWVSVPFSRGSSQARDRTQVSCTAGKFFTSWATRKWSCSAMSDSTTSWTVAYQRLCGILQASILEWVAISFSSRSSWPRNWTGIFCTAGGFFTSWATSYIRVNPGSATRRKQWRGASVFGYITNSVCYKLRAVL